MTESHEPMDVHMHVEQYPHGGHMLAPVPMMDPDWSDLDKLRWHAGVVKAVTGITVSIVTDVQVDTASGRVVPGRYGYGVGNRSGSSYSYREMWVWLNGMQTGSEITATQGGGA